MAKTVSLDDSDYGQLVTLVGNLTLLTKKKISIGSAAGLAIGACSMTISKMSVAKKEILKEKLSKVNFFDCEKPAEIFCKTIIAMTEECKK